MRKKMILGVVVAILPVLAMAQRAPGPVPTRTVKIDHCTVSPRASDGEAQVPAQESGVITVLKVHEMDQVSAGALLANIDDALVQKQFKNAEAEYNAAFEKASGDIDIRFNEASAKTAEFEHRKNLEANAKAAGAVPAVELGRTKFQWDRGLLGIEQATKQKKVDGLTADAKKAEMESAQEQIKRREVRSPIDGVVQKIVPRKGEWVKPGDPVMRIVRMDSLRVDGYLEIDKYKPGDIRDRPVIVRVLLTDKKEAAFPGKIVFVDSEVQGEHEYQVSAEVDNRKENDEWLLRPGLPATMEIQLK